MKSQASKPAPMCIVGPKRRTLAYRALALLRTLGGSASPEQLSQVFPQEYRSAKKVIGLIGLIQDWRLVTLIGSEQVKITELGLEFLQERGEEPAVCKYVGEIVPVREIPAFKPMGMAAFSKLMAGGPQRPGMDDFRCVPSLMGDVRVVPGAAK
jgi:hypothetical protein